LSRERGGELFVVPSYCFASQPTYYKVCGEPCQPETLLKPFPEFHPPGPSWKFSEPP